ncbi:hypothetical protein GWI33_018571 [Rhynchophorus ferrugineus]|uniref:Uncharacterized protein n=1 Tax=Rhynchophorus ferrugineus TaxID=354439 RepID=A0A834M539_RHYFE|nr:hypothetical protein GWI33_018571 [Rhynchophorus ferrugineus]
MENKNRMEVPLGKRVENKKDIRTNMEKSLDSRRNKGMASFTTCAPQIDPILTNITLYNCMLYSLFTIMETKEKFSK